MREESLPYNTSVRHFRTRDLLWEEVTSHDAGDRCGGVKVGTAHAHSNRCIKTTHNAPSSKKEERHVGVVASLDGQIFHENTPLHLSPKKTRVWLGSWVLWKARSIDALIEGHKLPSSVDTGTAVSAVSGRFTGDA